MPPTPPSRAAVALALRRAFTLIELLTVIAIIGILAAIIIPVVGRVRDSAKTTKCASNIRQMANAALLYAEENKGVLPSVTATDPWWWKLFPTYISTPEVFMCPSDQTTRGGADTFTRTVNGSSRTMPNGKVSYGAPGHTSGTPGTSGYVNWKAIGNRITKFGTPSRTVLFTEFQQDTLRLGENFYSDKPKWISSNPANVSPASGDHPAYPHGSGKANMAFLDGHIGSMTSAEVWQATQSPRSLWIGDIAP